MKHGKDIKVCIIGAGPSGITAAKHLLQVGITNLIVYDKNDQVGGNWIFSPDPSHSSVYETSHTISSKKLSQYHDFPIPDHYPDYPGHIQLLEYFQSYANHFGVLEYIQFNTEVVSAELIEDDKWKVQLNNGSFEVFDFLITANGHHWDPILPEIEGKFTGNFMHSHYYKTNLPFKDQRVLVIGAGNSACDIAVDLVRHSESVDLSWRRGYWVVPKHLAFGMPPDVLNSKIRFFPKFIRKFIDRMILKIFVGNLKNYGLPKPNHHPTESHPILNTQLLYYLKHKKITPRNDVSSFNENTVYFKDGSSADYDTIIAGTGYNIRFPFFNYQELDFTDRDVDLYLRMFHPKFKSLAIIGLLQPQGCIWPLSDTQAELVANYILGNYNLPKDIDKLIEKEVRHIKNHYLNSPRHRTEVNYYSYLKKLKRSIPKKVHA
jgi:hypothetical protein